MKSLVKYFVLASTLLIEIFPASIEEDSVITDSVVVVGNKRKAGTVIDSVSDIVDQSGADFSYSKPIGGKEVVSVDLEACTTGQPHIQGDFTTTKSFASGSQAMVIFEWFPPSEATLLKNQMTLALKKAFEILKPGGELIIDSHPFFDFVTGFSPRKIEILQQLNPFSLVFDQVLLVEIQSFASGKATSKAELFQKSLNIVATILKKKPKRIQRKFGKLLSDVDQAEKAGASLVKALQNTDFYLFLWAYHSFSCNEIIAKCLKNIGFDISKSQIGIVKTNPFNQRKWAWMVSGVIKPIKEIPEEKEGTK